jgi:putative transposase
MNYTQRLAEANLVPSVGSVGDSYDCDYVAAA